MQGAEFLDGAQHLRWLAREPRPTGSASAADARRYCSDVLRSLGYRVSELPFEYSAAVGKYGTPAGGLFALAVIALSLGRIALVAAIVMLVVGGRWLARQGVLDLPVQRRQGVNIEACRNDSTPEVWLVAHIDSKSQPVPLIARAAGIVLLSIALLFPASPYRVIVGLIGAVPVIASFVGRRSPGAVDNASGVATVLAAASQLPPDAPIGVLITDAEELGLAGARAWCVGRAPAAVLNCDGIDDTGTLTLMWTRPRAARLEKAMREAADEPLRVIPLVPGVLVDGVAFSNAGWEAVTLSCGTLGTLRRIHTRDDNLDHLKGTRIASAASVLARAAITLTERR